MVFILTSHTHFTDQYGLHTFTPFSQKSALSILLSQPHHSDIVFRNFLLVPDKEINVFFTLLSLIPIPQTSALRASVFVAQKDFSRPQ